MIKKRLCGLFLISVILCSACSAEKSKTSVAESVVLQEQNSDGTAPEKDESYEKPVEADIEKTKENILRFVDAHGEWHEMTVNPDVRKHNYNWDYLKNDNSGIFYEGDDNYTIRRGVDVSYYQGIIDWEKVKEQGYDFAILRIGYRGYGEAGTLNMDEAFYTNLEKAKEQGFDIGVYFFAQAVNEKEALEEAEYVLDALEGYEITLPVVYDPELIRDDEARTDNVTGAQFTKNTIVFCEKIKEAGYQPMIYSNLVWESELFDMEQLQMYPVWYADYETVPQTPYDFQIWQYTESGQVDGIEGKVDLNIMFCPPEE